MNCSEGTYAGDNTSDRAITHGHGEKPKLVMIWRTDGDGNGLYTISSQNDAKIFYQGTASQNPVYNNVSAMDATDFHVGVAGAGGKTANYNGHTYQWMAIS